MKLWEEAEKISIFGLEVYRFGFFVALGMLAAACVIGFLSWARRCRKGTAPVLTLLAFLLGAAFSRICFCLMNQELGFMMPISSWFNITGGGWSMIGLVGGSFLAAFLTAKITGEKVGHTMDLTACALPAFLLLERIGENCIPDFDYSRALESTFLNRTFLVFSDEYDAYYLATNRLAAVMMGLIFLLLIVDMMRSHREGNTCLMFLMVFGAVTILLESLRYDRFLRITFVGLQQILAAVLLMIGVAIPAVRCMRSHRRLAICAIVSVLVAAGIGVALEFALDRTTMNRILIYALFTLAVSVPVILGVYLREKAA